VNWSVKTGIIVRGERTRTVAVCGTVAGSDTRNSCAEGQCELECKDRNYSERREDQDCSCVWNSGRQ